MGHGQRRPTGAFLLLPARVEEECGREDPASRRERAADLPEVVDDGPRLEVGEDAGQGDHVEGLILDAEIRPVALQPAARVVARVGDVEMVELIRSPDLGVSSS